MISRVAVIGLGKLGACMAAVFADVGHLVVGVDLNPDTVASVRAGIAPVDEPGLQDLYTDNRARLLAIDKIAPAVQATDIAFVIVPTPSLRDGTFDHSIVLEALYDIGTAVGDGEYTVVVCSTVMPGTCRDILQPALDEAAGRHVPLCYSPEFIALGSVIRNMRYPDMVLVGADDEDAALDFVAVMEDVVHETQWSHMSLVNAELAKISVNSFVTMKISFANQLADVCEGIAGADARVVTNAIGHDERVGSAYLEPGGPYGGPCFPRDNRAFQALAISVGADAPLAAASDAVNHDVVQRIAHMVPYPDSVVILGLTYKPNTNVTEESLGSRLLTEFPEAEVHDPMWSDFDPQELLNHNRCVVVATAWPEYYDLDYQHNIVVDVWGILAPGDNIVTMGVGPNFD